MNETHYGHGLVATSIDGVHFEEHSAFNAEVGGVVWDKCMIHKVHDVDGKPMFVMDHGTAGPVPDSPGARLPNDRGCPKGTKQCLRFLKSTDALNWEYMYTLHPDTRWYHSTGNPPVSDGRWDHAYIQEDLQRGGFIGFPVATPAPPHPPAPGILRSSDGLNWTVHEPVLTQWEAAAVDPAGFEIGGVERMPNGRYYMIGGGEAYGYGYSMFTLISNSTDVAGPYAPDPNAYRLSGQSKTMMAKSFNQALAAWSRNYDTYPKPGSALISQYMVMPHTPDIPMDQKSLAGGGHVWLLPFRQPILDEDDHLRLAHWDGNSKMKGDKIAIDDTITCSKDSDSGLNIAVAFIEGSESWDHLTGVVISGLISVPGAGATSVGVVVNTSAPQSRCEQPPCDIGPQPDQEWRATAMLMDVEVSPESGNSTRVWELSAGNKALKDLSGPFECGTAAEKTTCLPATSVTVAPGQQFPFLLYCRHGTLELYAGEPLMLVQTSVYGIYPQARGRVGLAFEAAMGTTLKASSLEAWKLDL